MTQARDRFVTGVSALALIAALSAESLAQSYNEAPELAERVAAGELPPVEERLPSEPEVVTPIESIGSYGGQLRYGLSGSSDHNNILRMVGPQGLVRWNPDYTGVIPNLARASRSTRTAPNSPFISARA